MKHSKFHKFADVEEQLRRALCGEEDLAEEEVIAPVPQAHPVGLRPLDIPRHWQAPPRTTITILFSVRNKWGGHRFKFTHEEVNCTNGFIAMMNAEREIANLGYVDVVWLDTIVDDAPPKGAKIHCIKS